MSSCHSTPRNNRPPTPDPSSLCFTEEQLARTLARSEQRQSRIEYQLRRAAWPRHPKGSR